MPKRYPLDALGGLLPLLWRNIEVPAQVNSITANQRCVEHKQWGVAGAHVENTGRDSARFPFRIPFRGGISGYTDLYPSRFHDFFNACLDGSAGKLQHPDFGELDARVFGEIHVNYDPARRDGVDLDVTWIETNENGYTLEQVGIFADAIALAGDLESRYGAILSVKYPNVDNRLSLGEAMGKIKGAMSLGLMGIQGALAQIEGLINTLNSVIDLMNTVSSPEAWAATDIAKSIESVLAKLKMDLPGLSATRKIDIKVNPKEEPCANAATRYGLSLNDFFALNPMYGGPGVVPAGGLVTVYLNG
jgi:hypothetical protein